MIKTIINIKQLRFLTFLLGRKIEMKATLYFELNYAYC